MGKEYWGFENETGDTGFLAGVADVLSDNLEMLLDYGYALDADVFYVKDNDISQLNDVVRKRLHNYKSRYGLRVSGGKIDAIDFELEKIDGNANDVLCGAIRQYSSNKEISESVDEFFRCLNWYLQEPFCVYKPTHGPDKNVNVLGQIYLYTAWEYFFVSYYDYLVLFIFGTVE